MTITYQNGNETPTFSLAAATMPTDLSMWNITPTTGNAPLTIQWLGYLTIQGYAPTYPVMDSEYVQLQVSDQMGNWIDIPWRSSNDKPKPFKRLSRLLQRHLLDP